MQRMIFMCTYHDFLTKLLDSFTQNRKGDFREQFHCRIHAEQKIDSYFYELFQEIYEMRSESVLFISPAISVDVFVFQ